ncbi:deazapurine DNA modification protein DpdA family protein [Actinokineospora sp. NPDC004072]
MKFYLGTHQPSWLARDLGVPLLVSHRRLTDRRTLPRATGPWVLDSGGFTELSLHGRWRTDATTYVRAVRRYATEIGHLQWAAPRDWMTEPHVLARTGLSLRAHQHRTVTDYLRLRDLDPQLPFIPVLQGQTIGDYHRCADLYEHHGIDLAALPLVGVGSVCRRQHTAEVEDIVRSLAARGYRLHAFGAKVLGLARYADAIISSDSASWSLRGRHVPGCTSTHRSESNCLRFALAWHQRLISSLPPEGTTAASGKRHHHLTPCRTSRPHHSSRRPARPPTRPLREEKRPWNSSTPHGRPATVDHHSRICSTPPPKPPASSP